MRLYAKDGLRGRWIDLRTGWQIRWVIWGDTETGEYLAWRYDEETCQRMHRQGAPLDRLQVSGKVTLRFIPAVAVRELPTRTRPKPAEQIAAICEIAPDYVPDWKPITPEPGIECDAHGCHRLAEYETGDDCEIEPEKTTDGRLCQRAVTIAVHRYCPWHFRAPVHTNLRGVQREKAVRIRPQ